MRVFVAGASGAIGTRLVPQLSDRGHEVIGAVRSPENAERVRALGAKPVLLDLLDAAAVRKAVAASEPEAIVHQATALADARFTRSLDRSFAQTNRLRTEGTDNLLAAAREAGVRRFVAQSVATYGRYAREGGPVKTEDDPLDTTPVAGMRETAAALHHLDQAVTDAGGIALRYGAFYGASNDGLVEPVRKRQFPIVGDGGGFFSWIHLDDAAAATALALEHDDPGVYNIVDDEPARVREWLPALADALGRQAAPTLSPLAGAAVRGRTGGDDGNRGPRRLEREGQARAGLGASLPELAPGLRCRLRGDRAGGRGPTASRGQSKALTDLGDELGPHAGPLSLLLYSSHRVNISKGARRSHGTNADRQRAGVAGGA